MQEVQFHVNMCVSNVDQWVYSFYAAGYAAGYAAE